MNGFDRRRQAKMDAVLQAASDLFLSRGVKDVTVAEIAKKARVSQVTIYNYFGSKDNLAKRVLFALFDRLTAQAEELFRSDLPFRAKFEAAFAFKRNATTDPIVELINHVHLDDPDVQRFLEDYDRLKTMPLLAEFIEQGKREGCVDPGLATESVLLYLKMLRWATVKSGLFSNLSKETSLDLEALIFYGLRGKPVGD